MSNDSNSYIAMDDCKIGFIYLLCGERLDCGVYAGEGQFIGIDKDKKFPFLFVEKHIEVPGPSGEAKDGDGTCFPQMEFDELPKGIVPVVYLSHADGPLWGWRNNKNAPVRRRDRYPTENVQKGRDGIIDIWADSYIWMPDDMLPYRLGNMRLYDFMNEYELT